MAVPPPNNRVRSDAASGGSRAGGGGSVPALILMGGHAGKPPIVLNRPIFVIGSHDRARIHLNSESVSRHHAVLAQTRHQTYIRDLASRTHTLVNGEPVRERVLADGDVIKIGSFTFKYRGPGKRLSAEPPAPPAKLDVSGAEMALPIEEKVILIGRRPGSDIPLLEKTCSNAHAVIFEWEGRRFIRDLDSRSGTYVNGQRVHETKLNDGDLIRIGETDIRYLHATSTAAIEVDEMPALDIGAAALSQAEAEPVAEAGAAIAVDEAVDEAAPVAAGQFPAEQPALEPVAEAVEETPETSDDLLALAALTDETAPAEAPPLAEMPVAEEPAVDELRPLDLTPPDVEVSEAAPPIGEPEPVHRTAGGLELTPVELEPLEPLEEEPVAAAPAAPESPEAPADLSPPVTARGLDLLDASEQTPAFFASGGSMHDTASIPIPLGAEDETTAAAGAASEPSASADIAAIGDALSVGDDASAESSSTEATPADLSPRAKGASEPAASPAAAQEEVDSTSPDAEQFAAADEPELSRRGWRHLTTDASSLAGVTATPEPADELPEVAPPVRQVEPEPAVEVGESPPAPDARRDVDAAVAAADRESQDAVLKFPRHDIEDHSPAHDDADADAGVGVAELSPESELSPSAIDEDVPRLDDVDIIQPPMSRDSIASAADEVEQAPAPEEVELDIAALRAGAEPAEEHDADIDAVLGLAPESEPEPAPTAEPAPLVDLSPNVPPAAEPEAAEAFDRPLIEPGAIDFPVAPTLDAAAPTEAITEPAPLPELPAPRRGRRGGRTSGGKSRRKGKAAVPAAADDETISTPAPLAEPSLTASAGAAPVSETIEPTEPTPESALDISDAVVAPQHQATFTADVILPDPAAEMSDTAFGRAVTEFTGDATTGPIVEDRAAEEAVEPPQDVAPQDIVSQDVAAEDAAPHEDVVRPIDDVAPVEGHSTTVSAPMTDDAALQAFVDDEPAPQAANEPTPLFDEPLVPEPELTLTPDESAALKVDVPAAPEPTAAAGVVDEQQVIEPPPIEEIIPPVPSMPPISFMPPGLGINQDRFLGGFPVALPQVQEEEPVVEAVPPPPRENVATYDAAVRVDEPPVTPVDRAREEIHEKTSAAEAATPARGPLDLGDVPPLDLEPLEGIEPLELDEPPADTLDDAAVAELLAIEDLEPPAPAAPAEPVARVTDAEAPVAPPLPVPQPATPPTRIEPPAAPVAVPLPQPQPRVEAPAAPSAPAEPPTPPRAPVPPARELLSPAMGARRPRRRRDQRPTVIGFGGNPDAMAGLDVEIPPFAGSDPASFDAAVKGFAGLAAAPVSREADVFAQASPAEPIDENLQPQFTPLDEAPPLDLVRPPGPEGKPVPAPTSGLSDMAAAGAVAHAGAFGLAGTPFAPGVAGATVAGTTTTPPPGNRRGGRRPRPTFPGGDGAGLGGDSNGGDDNGADSGHRGSIPPRRPQPAIDYDADRDTAAELAEAARQRRRRLLRRATVLFVTMLVLIGAAVVGSYYLFPNRHQLDAHLVRFANFDVLTQRERSKEQQNQYTLLKLEGTRNTAVRILVSNHPEVDRGWLADPVTYSRVTGQSMSGDTNAPGVTWTDADHKRVMTLRFDSTDPAGDMVRLRAIADAMNEVNTTPGGLADLARQSKKRLADLDQQMQLNRRKREDLVRQIDQEKAIGESAPTAAQIAELQQESSRLQKAYDDAIVAARTAQADLDKLRQQLNGGGNATTQPAGGLPPALANDAHLVELQKQADQLAQRLHDARESRAADAARAKQTLDDASSALAKQLDATTAATKDNNLLADHIRQAQNLQAALKQLTDEYLDRQQQQYAGLLKLKDVLEHKVQERKTAIFTNDPTLSQLTDQRARAAAARDAALAKNNAAEADDRANELKLIDNSVRARQEVLANDPTFADEINRLQASLDQTVKAIAEDRRLTDERLQNLMASFVASKPVALDSVPAEQRQAVESLHQKFNEYNDARRNYATTLASSVGIPSDAAAAGQAASAAANEELAKLQNDLLTTNAQLDARRKQLVAQDQAQNAATAQQSQEQRKALDAQIDEKAAQVASLRKAESDAQAAFVAKHNELLKAQSTLSASRESGERMIDLQKQLALVESNLSQDDRSLQFARDKAAATVEPLPPSDADVQDRGEVRQWPLYAGGSALAIAVVFMTFIFVTLINAMRGDPYHGYVRNAALAHAPEAAHEDHADAENAATAL